MVKIFSYPSSSEVESAVNAWLSKDEKVVLSLHYAVSVKDYEFQHCVLINYEIKVSNPC